MTAHAYHAMCGCDACCRVEESDERLEEAIESLLCSRAWRTAHVQTADELLDGTFSPEHYTAVERALADLSEVPTDRLIGSDALAKVLRLAAIHGEARDRELRDLAASQAGAMGRAA